MGGSGQGGRRGGSGVFDWGGGWELSSEGAGVGCWVDRGVASELGVYGKGERGCMERDRERKRVEVSVSCALVQAEGERGVEMYDKKIFH